MYDDMIADIKANRNVTPKVIELVLRGRQLNISLGFLYHNIISKFLKL